MIQELKQENLDEKTRQRLQEELDDLFLAVQLYSYPGDYVAEEPTIERMAETLDKFEEDVLNRLLGDRARNASCPRPVRRTHCGRTQYEPQDGHPAADRNARAAGATR